MQIWGKIVGALIGFMFLRVPGLVLGLVVGHMFDQFYSRGFSHAGGFARFFSDKSDFQQQAEFFHCLFAALGHICKADGAITKADIAVASRLMDDMALEGEVRQEAQQAFRDGKARDFPMQEMLKEFKASCHGRRDIVQIYLEILIQAACESSRLSSSRFDIIQGIAQQLGFSQRELGFLVATFEASSRFRAKQAYQQNTKKERSRQSTEQNHTTQLSDAYRIIGLSEDADEKSIKRAYKKAMATHHPDKLVSKGLPEQALQMAKQKTQDIQAAYQLIKESRGF